jgi:hypothetical protein
MNPFSLFLLFSKIFFLRCRSEQSRPFCNEEQIPYISLYENSAPHHSISCVSLLHSHCPFATFSSCQFVDKISLPETRLLFARYYSSSSSSSCYLFLSIFFLCCSFVILFICFMLLCFLHAGWQQRTMLHHAALVARYCIAAGWPLSTSVPLLTSTPCCPCHPISALVLLR